MIRRKFILLAASAAACPWDVWGQAGGSVAQIGVLYPGLAAMTPTRIAALREGLRAVGYVGADRVEFLVRASEGDGSRLASLAEGLVTDRVTAIVAVSPSALRAARSATVTIPIVANDLESDPVASGFVKSLAHPGGNLTGVFSDFPEFGTKWLELLTEAIPGLSRVAAMWDPATSVVQLEALKIAANNLKVAVDIIEVRAIGEIGRAFQTAREQRPNAIIILSSPIFGTNPRLIADLTIQHHIPTATLFSEIARAGSLMSYGPNLLETFRQSGTMLGKVLQGAKPAELPIERPTKFEMVINMKTARALGVAVPTSLLLRADEVIE